MMQFLPAAQGILLKIVTAFIIFLIGLIIGKFAGMLVKKLLYELQIDQILETIGVKFFFSDAAGRVVSFLFYIAGIALALRQLGLEKIATIILIVFFSIILLVSLLLDATDMVRNFLLGIYMRKRFFRKKEISSEAVKGRILKVKYTGLKIMTREKDVLFVPYSALAK